jgi:hypothetical protein
LFAALQNALLVGMLSGVSVLRARSDPPGWGETRNCRSRTHADDHLDTLPATGIVVPWQSLLTRADPPVKNSLRGPFRAYVESRRFPSTRVQAPTPHTPHTSARIGRTSRSGTGTGGGPGAGKGARCDTRGTGAGRRRSVQEAAHSERPVAGPCGTT